MYRNNLEYLKYIVLITSIYCYISSFIVSKGKYYKFLPTLISANLEHNGVLRRFYVKRLIIDATLLLFSFLGATLLDKNNNTAGIVLAILSVALVINLIIHIRGNRKFKQDQEK